MAETLAERVKRARAAADLTQREVATKAGVSITVIRNIEQGITTDPRMSSIGRILGVLSEATHAGDGTSGGQGQEQTPLPDPQILAESWNGPGS